MGAIGKLRTVQNGHSAYCPGCEEYHFIPNTWHFNGNYGKPTFNPSLLVQSCNQKWDGAFRCHSFITNGEWQFQADCTHALKNATVALRDEEFQDFDRDLH